ncbi:hypothetical protein ACFL0H_15575 [Thermodesulfobacteriota bacterium]
MGAILKTLRWLIHVVVSSSRAKGAPHQDQVSLDKKTAVKEKTIYLNRRQLGFFEPYLQFKV